MKKFGQKVLKSREVDLGRPRQLDIVVWDSPARSRRSDDQKVPFHPSRRRCVRGNGPVYYQDEMVYLTVRHWGPTRAKVTLKT